MGEGFDAGDAWQFFGKVVGVAGAVIGRVEQAVDVVENVFLADGVGGGVAAGLPGVGGAEMLQAGVGDGVAARISRGLFGEQAARGGAGVYSSCRRVSPATEVES